MAPHIPSFKLIPGTDFSVDAFRYPLDRLKAYFLTHAHADHYTGLSEKWHQGPIYCTEVTGKLVCHITGVSEEFIHVLPMNEEVTIHGVKVTAVDANHCPGAALLLFQVSNGDKYVHCGDFRGCAGMQQCPHLQRFVACKGVFLDTTYCHPKHMFPDQSVAVEEVGRLCELYMQEAPQRLILISSYTIGKERLFMEIARRCKVKICVTQAKFEVMQLLPWPEDLPLEQLFTTDPHSSPVHVVQWNWLGETWPYFRPNYANMEISAQLYGYKSVVGFVPTGFAFQKSAACFPVHEKPPWKIHLIPYSEHSSFTDLQDFVRFLRPQNIIPTVGVSGEQGDTSSHKMLEHFRHLCDQSGAKRAFLGRLTAAADASKHQNSTAVEGSNLQADKSYQGEVTGGAAVHIDACSEEMGLKGHLEREVEGRGDSAVVNNCGAEQESAPSTNHAATAALSDAGLAEDPEEKQSVNTLMAVIGDSITEEDAMKLLKKCGNSIERAANCFYDQKLAPKSPLDASKTPSALKKQRHDPYSAPGASSSGSNVKEKAKKVVEAGSKVKETTKKLPSKQLPKQPPGKSAKAQKQQKQDKGSSPHPANQKSIMSFMQSPKQSSSSLKCVSVQQPKASNLSGSGRGQKRSFACVAEQVNGTKDAGELLIDMTEECEVDLGNESASRGQQQQQQQQLPGHLAGKDSGQKHPVLNSNTKTPSDVGMKSTNNRCLKESLEEVSASVPSSAHLDSIKPKVDDAKQGDSPMQMQPDQDTHAVQERKLNMIHPVSGSPVASTTPAGGTDASPADCVYLDAEDTGEENTASQQLSQPAATTQLSPPLATAAAAGAGVGVGAVSGDCSVLLPLERYCPRKHACWSSGSTPYMHIAATFAAMDSTTKRLRIGDALTNMFRSVMLLAPDDLEAAALLTVGKLAAEYEGVELQVGGSTVASAVVDCTGVTSKRLSEMYVTMGDLGDVAEKCKTNQRTLMPHPHLTVKGVFAKLHEISATKGTRSAQRKQSIIAGLLRASRGPEVKFIVRTLVQNLRVGANWRSVVRAIGCAAAIHHSQDKFQNKSTAAQQGTQDRLHSPQHYTQSAPAKTASTQEAKFPSKQQLTSAAEAAVEAFHSCPSLAKIVEAVQCGGVEQLRRLGASVGVPVKPMLAKITAGVGDCVKQTTGAPVLVEWKYDGQRAQIHVSELGQVTIYSRNCEDKTAMFPDVCTCILEACSHTEVKRSFIVDSELVAVDRADNNRLRAFQDLSTRAREGVSEQEVSVHVCIFLFDILYLDGDALMKRPFRERRITLERVFTNLKPGHVELAQSYELRILTPDDPSLSSIKSQQDSKDETLHDKEHEPIAGNACNDADCVTEVKTVNVEEAGPEIEGALLGALASGAEGLMLKFLDTRCAYEPSKRADSWLKLKKDYCEGLRDSLDLVPIGAWHGNGRKAGWYSPFLLACWDPEREEFQSLCRVMSGFSDVFYKAAKERYDSQYVVPSKLAYVNTSETPDVWFAPTEVWEIRGADLTLSPVHKAAVGRLHPDRGCSLRFPRFIQIREDKAPEDASGPDYISDLFRAQTRKSDNRPDTEAPNTTDS